MSFSLQTLSIPFYTQRVPLEGTNYNLTFRYSQRCDCWYLSIADDAGNDIVNGIKLVVNFPLLDRFAFGSLPPGELIVITNTNDDSTPGLFELGVGYRCELVYFTAAEIAGLTL